MTKNTKFFLITMVVIFSLGWANRIIVKDNVPPFQDVAVLDAIRDTPVVAAIRSVRNALAVY
jgi:hypothetical protein